MIKKRKNFVRRKEILTNTNERSVNIEKVLVENFVSLQKVMVNLSLKFDNLSTQISKLLELFEISAKSLAKRDFRSEENYGEDKNMVSKLDNLLDQNKTIARGIELIHDPNASQLENKSSRNFEEPKPMNREPLDKNEYQRSISSNQKDVLSKP